jgi:crotonobetainyl-CoA:carnitine CoA-transferase CaiB-like acyl-CoA transferase
VNAKTEVHNVAHWIEILNRAGVPAGRVQTLDQVFQDPQVLAQDMVLETKSGGVDVKVTGFPVKLSNTPARLHHPPPGLGEHTEVVLERLGFSAAEIAELRETKVV